MCESRDCFRGIKNAARPLYSFRKVIHVIMPPPWILGAVAYGMSWLADLGPFSFLAWFSFVPLFAALERQTEPGQYLLRALGYMTIATVIGCWWWFFAAPERVLPLVWAAGIQEILLESVPLLLLYPVKKKLEYPVALFALVFFWPLWEWLYHKIPLSLGFLFVGNTQAGNLSFIQFADLFGVWGITSWVILVNVSVFVLLRRSNFRFSVSLLKPGALLIIVLLGIPLLYGAIRQRSLSGQGGGIIQMALIRTDYDPFEGTPEQYLSVTRQTLAITDRALANLDPQFHPNLIVWPEAIAGPGWDHQEMRDLLAGAVNRWRIPLLTGMVGPSLHTGEWANQSILVPVDSNRIGLPPSYDKIQLIPFWETLPFYRYLNRLEFVEQLSKGRKYKAPGEEVVLLPWESESGGVTWLGTPICHEQNYPELWAAMTRKGAGVFVHLAFESWFGDYGFKNSLAGITRIRCIENRRYTARVSNGGYTAVFDVFGREMDPIAENEYVILTPVRSFSGVSFYSTYPAAYPILCMVVLAGMAFRASRAVRLDNVTPESHAARAPFRA